MNIAFEFWRQKVGKKFDEDKFCRTFNQTLILAVVKFLLLSFPFDHRQENRRLVGHFYDMKNRFWAVGCGLGWAVE